MSTSEYLAQRSRGGRLTGPRVLDAARSISTDVWIVAALVVVATVIRVITIDTQSFWQDEALTAYEAGLPFGAMLHTVVRVETTPPLYFILAWLWGHLFGVGEVSLRSISVVAGIALVPIAYLSTRELVSRWAGVLAAAFVTVNPFLIWYSQEARAYMLLAALTGASFLWFARARREPSRRNVGYWAVFSALALMTHFFAGFLVAPEALWLLWVNRTGRVLGAVALVGVTQVAMLPFAVADTGHGVSWITAIPQLKRISNAIAEWGVSILYWRVTIAGGLVGGGILLVIAALLIAFGGDRRTIEGARVAVPIAGFVVLAPLALALVGQDYFLSRNIIPALIPLTAVIAAACTAPRARLLGGALAVALLVMFSVAAVTVQTSPALQRPNWRSVARALDPPTVPRAILASGGLTAQPLKIYMPGVDWTKSHTSEVRIREVDVVGAQKRMVLLPVFVKAPEGRLQPLFYTPSGSPVPRSVAPSGARLISLFRVHNWTVARFALAHPMRISIDQLTTLAPEFFRRTPQSLLVFFQPAGR